MAKGSIKSTINRTSIENKILKVLTESDKPLSTQEIASNLGNSWHTIIRYCLDLEIRDKIFKFSIGRIYAWQIKK